MQLMTWMWGKSRALPPALRPAQRSFKAPFFSALVDPKGAGGSFPALVPRRSGKKTVARRGTPSPSSSSCARTSRRALLQCYRRRSYSRVARKTRAPGRTGAHSRPSAPCEPAGYLRSPSSRRRAPSEHDHLQLGSALNDKRRGGALLRGGVQTWRREAAQSAGRRGASGSAALGFLALLVYLINRFFVKSILSIR